MSELTTRQARLATMDDEEGRPGLDQRVRKGIKETWDQPGPVLIPDAFVYRERVSIPARAQRPPCTSLIAPRGQTLRLLLTIVADAALRTGADPRKISRGIDRTEQQLGWLDLLAVPAAAGRDRVTVRKAERNQIAQLQSALARLERARLVTLTTTKAGRPKIRLNDLAGDDGLATPRPFTRPGQKQRFAVPAAFFKNGWLWCLEDSEIATYLMIRQKAARHPGHHASGGVFAVAEDREYNYGIPKDTYEAHRRLVEFELIERIDAPGRRIDGRITGYSGASLALAHRFKLKDATLDQVALPEVQGGLRVLNFDFTEFADLIPTFGKKSSSTSEV
jgi:hypothetical protein